MKVIHLFLLLILFSRLDAQSPYELTLEKDIPILLVAFGGQAGAGLMIEGLQPLTEQQISALDKNDINSFDRPTVGNYSGLARNTSDIFLYTAPIYPVLLMLDKPIRKDFVTIAVMSLEVILANGAATTLTKGLAKRPRPFVYNSDVPLDVKQDLTARLSFYSGHTSAVSSLSYFAAKVLIDYHPDTKLKPLIWAVATALPATTGYLRYAGGKHFPTDVMTGLVAGGLVGLLIPALHKKSNNESKVDLSLVSATNGVGLRLTW